MSLANAALAEKLIRLLRETVPDAPQSRAEVADLLGISERTLRRVREIAERVADFPIGMQHGYCRLWTRREVAREIRHRREKRMAYKHLIALARPKQEELAIARRPKYTAGLKQPIATQGSLI